MQIVNQTRNVILADNVSVADNPFSRMKGLLGRSSLGEGQALVIKPSDSIHTFFMRCPIDIIFVGKDNKIIKAVHSLPPFRMTAICFKSYFVIELPSGTITATGTQPADIIKIS